MASTPSNGRLLRRNSPGTRALDGRGRAAVASPGARELFRRRPSRTLAAALALLAGAASAVDPPAPRRAELVHLLRHDCGSCHGMTLAGGLGPPLTVAALRDAPPAALEATILHGRPGTPMPPWRGLLSGEEVRWLVQALKSGRLE